MDISIIPEMSPEDLERVLKYLPQPTDVEVALFGDFDYSGISRQAEEVVEGIRLGDDRDLKLRLQDPSKEMILKIYQSSRERKEELEKGAIPTGISRRVDLHAASWYIDGVQIELTPWEVNVRYSGREPNYISQMRQELAGTNVRLRIKVNE